MVRIISLVLGFGVSCLLVAGLLGLTERFAENRLTDTFAENPAESGGQTLPGYEQVTLPAPIPGTGLIAERLVMYDGPFLEDGSDEPVVNALALVIRNAGSHGVAEAQVVLERAGERYEFSMTYILPGMSVMVLEQSASAYFRDGITGISGWERQMEENSLPFSDLQLVPLDMGSVAVTNRTAETKDGIILYHKNHLPDGTFVGGITYQTALGCLQPGETQTVFPEHYADGYSKIFCAEYQPNVPEA